MLSIIFFCLIMSVFVRELDSVEIKISQGIVRGLRIRTFLKRNAFAFLGIPYATPPYNQLRFKPPVPHPGWSQTLDATNYRSSCPQYDFRGTQLGSEDCLFLNVFTPNILIDNTIIGNLYPVMVYFQAESFESGDSSLYGPEKLLDKQVVVVTFNYRLGILGFLSTEDSEAQGNWGLHDQKLVLEWVRHNIGHFYGDPNSVTIFGQGSGAASVIYNIISPLTQGLFHRAIAQSGSALCDWAIERSPLEFAREVAQSVGCPVTTTRDLVQCLKLKEISELLKVQSSKKIFGEFPQRAVPVIERTGDNRFIPDEPRNLLNSGNFRKVPLIVGINKDETSYFYSLLTTDNEFRKNHTYLENVFLSRFLDASTRYKGDQQKQIKQSILFRYFNGVDTTNISDISTRFINMTTDALYTACIDETVKFYSQHKEAETYMYLFAYNGRNSLVDILVDNSRTLFDTGVCHGDELFYLFDLKVNRKHSFTSKDNQITDRMLTLWTDFAKHGKAPQSLNYEYTRWERFDSLGLNYYRIDNELIPESGYRQSEAYFWTQHLANLIGITPNVEPLSNGRPMYQTIAWAMVGVSLSLLLLIVILIAIMYYQRRRQSFRAQSPENGSRLSSGGSSNFLY